MNTKPGLVLLIVLHATLNVSAADPVIPAARSQALANARVMLADAWSGLGNPAGLALLSGISLGIHYTNPFLVPELGSGAFVVGIPAFTGAFSLGYTTFGNSHYHENQICLSYGRAFGTQFRAGIGLHYLTVKQPADCGNLSALIPVLGIQAHPCPSLTLGLRVFNPAGQHYLPYRYRSLPAVVQSGLGYALGKEVLLCLEAEKCSGEPFRYYGGIEIDFRKHFKTRFGVSSGPFPRYAFGLGVVINPVVIDLAINRHPVLGFSPSITISLHQDPGNKKKS